MGINYNGNENDAVKILTEQVRMLQEKVLELQQ